MRIFAGRRIAWGFFAGVGTTVHAHARTPAFWTGFYFGIIAVLVAAVVAVVTGH